jgi:DNA topoisomerase-1
MRVAQSLYESGLITYMRTDSTNLSDDAIEQAKIISRLHLGIIIPIPSSTVARKLKVRRKHTKRFALLI